MAIQITPKPKEAQKIKAKCLICGKSIKIFEHEESLCGKCHKAAHKEDWSKLCDAIMFGK